MQLERPPRWRRLLKDAVASAIWRTRSLPLPVSIAPPDRHPLVIGYHRVVEDMAGAASTDMPTLLTSREMFERHIDWIGRHFEFVSLDEIGDHVDRGVPFPRPVAAITFDDGYRDVYEHALPVLQRKGIPAAMFVVTELVNRSCWQIHDRLYHLLDKAYNVWRDDPWAGLMRVLAEVEVPTGAIPGFRAASRNPYSAVSALLPALSQAHAGRLMTRGTGLLATIGATAPFVGLFGTVWGIMNSFIGISKQHTTNLAVVAPGIAEALLATALGLAAAIPAVVIYNMFSRAIAGYRALCGDGAAEVLRLAGRDLDRAANPAAAHRRGTTMSAAE